VDEHVHGGDRCTQPGIPKRPLRGHIPHSDQAAKNANPSRAPVSHGLLEQGGGHSPLPVRRHNPEHVKLKPTPKDGGRLKARAKTDKLLPQSGHIGVMLRSLHHS